MRDEPHDRARRGRAPCKPRRGDHRGCESRVEGATKGAARHTPPPCRGTEAAPRACDKRAAKGKRQAPPPPPHASAPPRVGDAGREGRTAAPPPEDKAARWGVTGERVRDGLHDRAQGKQAPSRPQRGGHRGCERRVGRAMTGATRRAPLPSRRTIAVPHASAVRATCLRRRKGSEPPPPPAPNSHTHQEKGRGQRGDGEGAWGMTVAGGGPPPRTPRQGGEAVGRECGTNHTTVPKGSTHRASPNGGTTGGATAGRVG